MKTFLFLLMLVPALVQSQALLGVPMQQPTNFTTQRNPVAYTDSIGLKLYLLRNGRANIGIAGTKTLPSLNLIAFDSGYSTHKIIALIVGSQGGRALIGEVGIRGDGGIFFTGSRSKDSLTSGVFAKMYYDSLMFNVAGTEYLKMWNSGVQSEKNFYVWNPGYASGLAPNIIFKTQATNDSAIFAYSSTGGLGEFSFDHMVAFPSLQAGTLPYAGAFFWSGDTLVMGTGQNDIRIGMRFNGASSGQVLGYVGNNKWAPVDQAASGTATVNKFGVRLSDGSVNLYPDTLLQLDVAAFSLATGQGQRADVSINPVGTITTKNVVVKKVTTDTVTSSAFAFVDFPKKINFDAVTSNEVIDIKHTNGNSIFITAGTPASNISQTLPGRAGTYMVSPDALVAGGFGYTDATDWKVLSPTNGSFIRGGSGAISYYDVYGSVSSWTADQRLGGAAIFPRLVLFNSTNSDSNGFQIRAGGLGMKFLRGWIGLPDAAAQSTTTGDLINSGNKLYFTEASNAKKRLVSQGDKFDFYFRTGVDTVIVTIPGMTVSGTGIPTWSTIRQTYGNLKMAYAQSGSVVIYSSAVEQVDSLHGTFVVIDY